MLAAELPRIGYMGCPVDFDLLSKLLLAIYRTPVHLHGALEPQVVLGFEGSMGETPSAMNHCPGPFAKHCTFLSSTREPSGLSLYW